MTREHSMFFSFFDTKLFNFIGCCRLAQLHISLGSNAASSQKLADALHKQIQFSVVCLFFLFIGSFDMCYLCPSYQNSAVRPLCLTHEKNIHWPSRSLFSLSSNFKLVNAWFEKFNTLRSRPVT